MGRTDSARLADAPADARLAAAWEAVERPDVTVLSTDVFDTLLWRQVPEPAAAFPLLADRLRRRGALAPGLSSAAFGSLRRQAEEQARQARAVAFGDLEATLADVYALLPDWIFLSPTGKSMAMDAELALEHELVVCDLDVAALLAAAGERGMRVVAVSDTYFSETQLRTLLDQPGLQDVRLDAVYSSSEHRRSKADGLLGVMLADCGVAAGAVVHLGDNPDADIAPARALGMGAVLFERHPPELRELLAQEARFAEPAPAEAPATLLPELTAIRGKVAARAHATALPGALAPFWSTGALVLGPVLTGFGEWVQERAAEHRLERLFCFMREGEFLTELVDRAGEAMELPARSERLWLNREVLVVASLADASQPELSKLLVRRRSPTVAGFVRSLGLALSDVPTFASHAETRLDDPVVRDTLLALIEGDAGLAARVAAHAREQRERVVLYVETLLDGAETMGVVDLGWGGTAQRLLRQIMASAGRPVELVGLYLATHEGAVAEMTRGAYVRGFLGEAGEPREAVRAITRTPEILEQLCMPDHGPQIALDERLAPVLAPAAHDRLQMAEAAALRSGVASFGREWARYRVAMPDKLPSLALGAHVLRPLLLRQLLAPTALEATLLGGWAHDENQGSARAEEIADLSHAGRLRHLAPEQLSRVPMEELYWPAGLVARSDPALAELHAAAAAGIVGWESLSSPVESGAFSVETVGTDVDPHSALREVPRRNRWGLSEVFGQITAPAIAELVLRPTEGPAVLRLDYLELRCHVEGQAEPLLLDLQQPADFARLARVNCFVLNPNVFVVHTTGPELRLDLRALTPRTVFRVDVRCGFALLPISQLLPTPGRLHSVEEAGVRVESLERQLGEMRRSLSWRLTRPLRLLQRLAR